MAQRIRPVKPDDMFTVSEIEQASFPDPWEDAVFEDMASHGGVVQGRSREKLFMSVMEEDGRVTGYIVWQESGRGLIGRVLNIAVREECRRAGQGRSLMAHAIGAMRRSGLRVCRLEVRESNMAARLLYENLGMTSAGRLTRYYGDEDGIIYILDL